MAEKRKRMTVSLPPELYDKVVETAKKEHRTQSEMVREAVRKYSVRQPVDLEQIAREAEEERKRLGLPPPRMWTDEEIRDFTIENEPNEEIRAEMLREMGIE